MKNKLHYAPEALRDLDDIWEYIALELNNPAAAKRTVSRIMDSADGLAEFAEAGAPLRSVADVESDYRFLVCGNYLMCKWSPPPVTTSAPPLAESTKYPDSFAGV